MTDSDTQNYCSLFGDSRYVPEDQVAAITTLLSDRFPNLPAEVCSALARIATETGRDILADELELARHWAGQAPGIFHRLKASKLLRHTVDYVDWPAYLQIRKFIDDLPVYS